MQVSVHAGSRFRFSLNCFTTVPSGGSLATASVFAAGLHYQRPPISRIRSLLIFASIIFFPMQSSWNYSHRAVSAYGMSCRAASDRDHWIKIFGTKFQTTFVHLFVSTPPFDVSCLPMDRVAANSSSDTSKTGCSQENFFQLITKHRSRCLASTVLVQGRGGSN